MPASIILCEQLWREVGRNHPSHLHPDRGRHFLRFPVGRIQPTQTDERASSHSGGACECRTGVSSRRDHSLLGFLRRRRTRHDVLANPSRRGEADLLSRSRKRGSTPCLPHHRDGKTHSPQTRKDSAPRLISPSSGEFFCNDHSARRSTGGRSILNRTRHNIDRETSVLLPTFRVGRVINTQIAPYTQ